MSTWLRSLGAGVALGLFALATGGLTPDANAQGRSHIEKSTNKRLSGVAYATLPNLTYEQCEDRCNADQQCVALEHFRAGVVRRSQCKLFSSAGETRDNRYSDVGFKRPGAGPAKRDQTADAKRKADEARKAQEVAQQERSRQQSSDEEARRQELARRADAERNAQEQQRQMTSPGGFGSRAPSPAMAPPASAPPPVASVPPPPPPSTQPPSAPAASPPAANGQPPPAAMERRSAPPPPPATSLPPPAMPRMATPPAPITPPPPPPVVSAPAPRPEPPVAAAPAPGSASGGEAAQPRPRSRGITRSEEAPATGGAPPPKASAPPAAAAPVAARAEEKPTDWDVVPVFYGTDRSRRDQPKRIAYGADRASRLELGRALVTVPKAHQVPNVERPWAIKVPYLDITLYQEAEDPKKHFTVKEIKAMSRDELLQLVRERLGGSRRFADQALVLVHGYNNGFDDALYRTAQIAYDLKFDGAPFLYSWPSGSGITSYPYDRESALQAEPYLAQFLQMVLNETGARQVNLIAHSMGNQPLLQVLRYLKQTNPAISSRINQIILAAPDVDRNAFEFLADQIRGVGRGITMYVSANDVALGISKRFAGGIPRAGDVPDGLGPAVLAGIDTIDVTALSTEYLALHHSTYAEKSALIEDIEKVILTGLRPPDKRLPSLERVKGDKGDYWRYAR